MTARIIHQPTYSGRSRPRVPAEVDHRPVDVDGPEEAQEFLMAVAQLALGENLADGHVQGGKSMGVRDGGNRA